MRQIPKYMVTIFLAREPTDNHGHFRNYNKITELYDEVLSKMSK